MFRLMHVCGEAYFKKEGNEWLSKQINEGEEINYPRRVLNKLYRISFLKEVELNPCPLKCGLGLETPFQRGQCGKGDE